MAGNPRGIGQLQQVEGAEPSREIGGIADWFQWLSHYPTLSDMQMTAGLVVVDTLGVSGRMGCICVEQACTSGGQALHDAWLAVASGRYDCVLSGTGFRHNTF